MVWFMNFCAPFMPNDPTINANRYIQVGILAAYSLLYALVYLYYLFYGPLPLSHISQPTSRKHVDQEIQDSSNMSDNKDLSIKLEEHANDSCVELKKTGSTWNHSQDQQSRVIVQNVTLQEIQQYHSIVYGHFAIAVGLSVMYTPYVEQSIAIALYVLLSFPLLLTNAYRLQKITRIFWITMALILMFLFTSGLLQIGQSNWDVLNLDCFANLYSAFYH